MSRCNMLWVVMLLCLFPQVCIDIIRLHACVFILCSSMPHLVPRIILCIFKIFFWLLLTCMQITEKCISLFLYCRTQIIWGQVNWRPLRSKIEMKSSSSGWGPQWLLRMSQDKQDTLLKMLVLSIAAILCKSTKPRRIWERLLMVVQ